MTIEVTRLASGLGAEVSGVDLRQRQDDTTIAAIRQAWLDHLVLLFRDQELTHEQHIDFSRRFGALNDHAAIPRFRDKEYPEILLVTNPEINGRKQPVGREWHSDLSTTVTPALGSLLRCDTPPEVGGDTMFTNMYLAYETLSDGMKKMLEPLNAVHDMTIAKQVQGRDAEFIAEMRRLNPPVSHPVVKVHPETGRKALYVAEMTTARIEGMTAEESRSILEFLYAHSTQMEFVYRHRWRRGDVLMWDNRCTMHVALNDYDLSVPRIMYRTTLLGETTGVIATDM